jgi:DNA adenine methylase
MAGLAPPFAYYGGKTRIAGWIASHLPACGHYVEPYAGSLAVLLAKAPAPMETVNDLDHDLLLFWRVLRDRPDELARACALTPHSRAEYVACRDLDGAPDEVERARRVWTVLSQGRAGRLTTTGWRHFQDPAGSSTSMPGYLTAYTTRIPAVARRLAAVSLECRPALEVIRDYGAHPDVLIYADPPYLGSTRGPGNSYRHELRTEAEHRELAEALHGCRATVVLSGYPSALYDELYAGWHRDELATSTGNGGTSRARTEVLWSNRPYPAAAEDLFGGQHAGWLA